jgi:hypothetical protein
MPSRNGTISYKKVKIKEFSKLNKDLIMSETELLKGKLKEFARIPEETFQSYVERFIKDKKQEIPSSYQGKCLSNDEVEEMFRDVFYKEHGVIIEGIIYEIVQIENYESDDIFEAKKQRDGSIDFILKYYNGGCSFTEAMEYAFEKMEQK